MKYLFVDVSLNNRTHLTSVLKVKIYKNWENLRCFTKKTRVFIALC